MKKIVNAKMNHQILKGGNAYLNVFFSDNSEIREITSNREESSPKIEGYI
jgi:hypothetical protein